MLDFLPSFVGGAAVGLVVGFLIAMKLYAFYMVDGIQRGTIEYGGIWYRINRRGTLR